MLETLTVNEENLDHHYTRHERSRSSRKEDERLPWRKAKRRVIQDLIPEWNGTVQELVKYLHPMASHLLIHRTLRTGTGCSGCVMAGPNCLNIVAAPLALHLPIRA